MKFGNSLSSFGVISCFSNAYYMLSPSHPFYLISSVVSPVREQ